MVEKIIVAASGVTWIQWHVIDGKVWGYDIDNDRYFPSAFDLVTLESEVTRGLKKTLDTAPPV